MLRKYKVPKESIEQQALIKWLKIKRIKFYAIPNGAYTKNILSAIHLKKTGLSNGVPDICIPIPFNGKHGLYIEMKRQKGSKTTPEQKEWLDFLNSVGYLAATCFGWLDAVKVIEHYFME